MAETRASKSKGRKLDSIISKLKIHPSQEAIDTQNEPSNTEKKENDVKEKEKISESNDVEKKRSKRKSQKIVRYRIDDDDDDNDITDTTEDPLEGSLDQVEKEDNHLPETIFEELPNGDTATFGEDTTVLFLPAEEIQVRTGPSDDYLGDLLEGGQDSHQEEEEVEEETSKEKKKKKKKKKTYDSDESLDEDGLPRRVTCTGCGRNVNPSHGTILRHPVLNVLVCKKCNQYYNSGPFTRDEYGIEEQCRWCGDGGDLICCDHCEKVYCKPCIQRNCGKTYLKNLLNAPEDFKWFCIVCQKDKPIKHIQRLRKKCDQVMQALENIKAQKAHFKSKKGQQTSVVIGPTTSERRNRLNCLSEGIKDGFSSSGESPTKKTFGKDADLPPELFSKIDDENHEVSDKDNDEDNKNSAGNESAETVKEKQDDMEEEDPTDSESTSRRRSLRSRNKDKQIENEGESLEQPKVEEDKQEEECDKSDEEDMVNLISGGEETSEQQDKPKTRSKRREQANKEQANKEQRTAKDITEKSKRIDNESNEEAEKISRKNKEKSKKCQNEEATEDLLEDVVEEENDVEEEVRVTRSGIKRVETKRKSVESSKSTPLQSDEEQSKSNKSKNKLKTIADKVKEENLTDEQDSSDSASGRRSSRKSKDRANRLMIKIDVKKKTAPPKTVVVLDSSDENDSIEQDIISEEQPKGKKKLEKGKVVEKSKGKKDLATVKSEKSTTSDSSDSRITKSRGKANKKPTESKAKSKKDSNKDSCSDSIDSDANLSSVKNILNKKKKTDLSSDSDFETKKVSKKTASKKKKSTEESSDSDFETKKVSKKTASKKRKSIEQSSDSDSVDTSQKVKSEAEEYSLEESSESDEESSESNSDVSPKTKRSRGLQKQTRKRPRPVESSSNSEAPSEDSSEDEGIGKRTRKRKQIESDSSDATAKTGKSAQNKRQKKTIKKGRKGKQRKTVLKSEESEVSDDEESSDSEPEEKRRSKKGKQKKKQKGKKPAKKKKRHRVKNKSDDESSDNDDNEEKSPSKGRKKIRKILTDDKLGEETQKARRLEEERRKRLLERTRTAEDDEMPKEDWHLNTVVLEKDKETKETLVEIHSDLVQHLKPHQSKGIQFMYNNVIDSIEAYKKGDKGGGCILAHCMGLGKTLQVVSLIHTLHNHKSFNFNTTLVIAPLNTVLNWQVEFDKWLNVDERMDVFVLKEAGHNNWHRADMLKQWQRYGGILIVGYDAYRNLSQCSRVRSKHQKKIFKESLVDPGPDLVVCDEGHILRNDQSAISRSVNSIKTRRRIVLTGTPLQNNLIEYHCMVSFVKPNLLGTRKEFMNLFGNPIMNGQCVDSNPLDVRIMKQSCHVLYKLLEACVQRRDYSVLTPFLPPKHEYVIKIRLSEVQRKLYSHYLSTFVYPEGQIEGSFSGRGASLFSDYQALMRIWTHPWCLKLEAIRRSLRAPYSDSDNSLDGFVVHTDEEEESESEPSSDEISLKSDDSLPNKKDKKKNGEVFELKSSSDEESGNDNTSDEEVMPQPSQRLTRSNAPIKIDDDEKQENGTANGDGESNTRSGNPFKEEVQEEKEWYDEFLTPEDEYNVELSGKLALLLEILADAEAVEEKVLVFSQSLVTLDLIERALGGGEVGGDRENWCRGCDYFRMDGSTSVQLRQRWADIFNDVDNKTARLFLISTKAGGLGINLVAANRVVVFDVSWNPSHDVQSIFRVYRFGQTKPVYVYRLVSEGSMEERIYDRQIAKLSTSQRVIDKHQIERHFTAADLAELYRFNPSVFNEETDKDNVPSLPLPKDAVLADLINRMHPKWIVKYHEHDSLLQNKTDEQLTDEECKQAWAAYEAQKNQAKQQFDARLLQAQYAQQQLQQQRQAVPSQNLNFSNAVLQQMQELQRQQLSERMARMQADAAMQGRHYQLPPMHNQQVRQHQQLLQHLGATRAVYQPRPGAPYQSINLYLPQQQQQQQAHRMLPPRLPTTAQPRQPANPPQPNTSVVLRHGAPPYSRM